MRLKLILCGVMLPPALILTGCGMDQMAGPASNVESPAISGRSFGGQQPLVGATIEVVEFGTAGYGSPATVLATDTTDINGNFSFAPGAYSCPQSDTPVYLLGIAGDSGSGNNPSAVTAAGLGTCTNAKSSFTVMNEITTTALAFSLAHFFNPTLGGSGGINDSFGGPSSLDTGGILVYSQGLTLGNNFTIPAIVSNPSGSVIQPPAGVTIDSAKIISIANVLAACINTSGSTSSTETRTTCGKLFHYTQNGAGIRPSDTLQAAVQMALYPDTDISQIFSLITPTPAFSGGLTGQPNDWTIGVSYSSSALGLAVDTGTASTLDIDSSNNIWFPSNLPGSAGAAYFDQASRTFNGPFNSTGLVHPQQVAIDAESFVWLNDSAAVNISGYLTTTPSTTASLSLPNTFSTGLTVGGDDRINVGINNNGTFTLGNIAKDRSGLSLESSINFIFPVSSLAGDPSHGDAVTITDPTTTTMRSYYVTSAPVENRIVNSNANSGQVIYTGNDDVSVRSYAGNNKDGLCIYSTSTCYNFAGGLTNAAEGIAIDGAKNLWVAESLDAGILNVPVNNPGALDGAVYLNSSGPNNVPVHEYLHGNGQGNTLITPYGIGIDAEGNVWVSNAGCTTNDCAPGSFTLTEIVGAASPTITPVSAQITSGINLVGTEPAK
jgi:hypothetical protein